MSYSRSWRFPPFWLCHLEGRILGISWKMKRTRSSISESFNPVYFLNTWRNDVYHFQFGQLDHNFSWKNCEIQSASTSHLSGQFKWLEVRWKDFFWNFSKIKKFWTYPQFLTNPAVVEDDSPGPSCIFDGNLRKMMIFPSFPSGGARKVLMCVIPYSWGLKNMSRPRLSPWAFSI